MHKIKVSVNRIFPLYGLVPSLTALLMNLLTYAIAKAVNIGRPHFGLALPIDQRIPLLPGFVWLYVGAYVFWFVNYALAARNGKDYLYKFITADFYLRLLCMLVFIVMPTIIERPAVELSSVSARMVSFVYRIDTPVNLFPSIHCFYCWMCFLAVYKKKNIPVFYQAFSFVMTVGVILSTLFIRQHYFVDTVAGVMSAQIFYLLKERLPFSGRIRSIFERLNDRLHLNTDSDMPDRR